MEKDAEKVIGEGTSVRTVTIRYFHDGGTWVNSLVIRTGYHPMHSYAIELFFDDPTDYERMRLEIERRFREHECHEEYGKASYNHSFLCPNCDTDLSTYCSEGCDRFNMIHGEHKARLLNVRQRENKSSDRKSEYGDITKRICDACLKQYSLDPASAAYHSYGNGCGREKHSDGCIKARKDRGIIIHWNSAENRAKYDHESQ